MFVNISLLLDFQRSENQIQMYDVPPASSSPYQSGEWVGGTEHGGSCNFRTVSITPHCHGTHTECIGHIVNDPVYLPDILQKPVFLSLLISLPYHVYSVHQSFLTNEGYLPRLYEGDKVLVKKDIEKALEPYAREIETHAVEGLIIRTLPNEISKKNCDYNKYPAPFFTNEAMELINYMVFKHLIVDIPSIDRAYDEGYLSNHHIFWNQTLKKYSLEDTAHKEKTITELVYVPDDLSDGLYETFLAFPQWKEEAVPSSVWIKKAVL